MDDNRPCLAGIQDKPAQSMANFFSKIKKGSKPYRLIIQNNSSPSVAHSSVITKLGRINEFLDCDTPRPQQQEAQDKVFHSIWHLSFIPHNFKERFIKFLKNQLLFNDQLKKENPLINDACSLCLYRRVGNYAVESIYHLILKCTIFRVCCIFCR